MPATTVHLGFALLVAAAVLPMERFDRRLLAVFAAVVVFPDLDSIPGWWLPGAHRAMFHTLVLAGVVAALLYYDTRLRDRSWLRERWGSRAVTVAWGLLATHLLAHLFLDWSHLSGINLLYPLADQFYTLEGELVYSTADGWIQTFVEFGTGADGGIDVGQQGSTDDVHVPTPTDPNPGGGVDRNVERIVPIAVHGWQLYLLLLGLFTVGARRLQTEPPVERSE
ncbi:metal-dependent hydrolase [Salinarchaeum laminariae]|uniref:metal-dependent hydrolase n=1 Tax=Salinarchaeum laminariae TaxID=869888 RepID=UPI0020BD51B9|nr:metal-dependent hydrolase [Salinarchaeum laminariae]